MYILELFRHYIGKLRSTEISHEHTQSKFSLVVIELKSHGHINILPYQYHFFQKCSTLIKTWFALHTSIACVDITCCMNK